MGRKYRRAIVWMLVITFSLSASAAYCQPAAESVSKTKVDVSYITPETVAAAVIYPRRVLTAPEMEMLPHEVITALGKKELGIDPLQIEQVLVVVEPPVAGPPGVVFILSMASPFDPEKILGQLRDRTTEAELKGKPYRRGLGPTDMSIFRADDRTLLVGMDPLLRKVLKYHAAPEEGRMSRLLGGMTNPPDAQVSLLVEPLRPLISAGLAMKPVPPPLAGAARLPDLVTLIEAKVGLVGSPSLSLSIRADDEEAAKQIETILNGLLVLAKQAMLAELNRQPKGDDALQQATVEYSQRISERMLQLIRPVRKGDTLTIAPAFGAQSQQLASISTVGVLMGLLLPAVQSARETARSTVSANNLKQIGLAMHQTAATSDRFPARANFDPQGKPLLSWRVHLLPHFNQETLYRKFHLDEPWDSEHNRQLIPLMPTFYQNPSAPPQPGKTPYLAVCGEGLAFGGTQGRKMAEFRDGMSYTILVVEADPDHAVIWTKPDDWQSDLRNPLAGLGNAHPSRFNVLFADGSVRALAKSIDAKLFRSLLTIAGEEMVAPRF